MAIAQVQHDGRVIGSLVAAAFHTTGSRIFLFAKSRPAPRHLQPAERTQRNPASFHAPAWRLASRNKIGVPLHLPLYFATSFAMQRTTCLFSIGKYRVS